jgi:hypothetical protein
MAGATVRLDYDDSRVVTGVKRTASSMEGVERAGRAAMGGLTRQVGALAGALAGLASINALKQTLDQMDRMAKIASRLDAPVESIQRLAFVADQNGASVEQLAGGLTRLTRQLGLTGSEGDKARDALARLGIDAGRFAGMGLEDQVYKLADALKDSGGDGEAFAATLDLIGLRGAELVPMLRQGGDALRELGGKVKVLTEDQVKKIEAFNDAWAMVLQNIQLVIASGLTDWLGGVAKALDGIPAKLDRFGDLMLGLAKIAGGELSFGKELADFRASQEEGRGWIARQDAANAAARVAEASPVEAARPRAVTQLGGAGSKGLMRAPGDIFGDQGDVDWTAVHLPGLMEQAGELKRRAEIASREAATTNQARADLLFDLRNLARNLGLPLDQLLAGRTRELSQGAADMSMEDAGNVARGSVGLELANQRAAGTRRNQIRTEREMRRLEREGERAARIIRRIDEEKGLSEEEIKRLPKIPGDDAEGRKGARRMVAALEEQARGKDPVSKADIDAFKTLMRELIGPGADPTNTQLRKLNKTVEELAKA